MGSTRKVDELPKGRSGSNRAHLLEVLEEMGLTRKDYDGYSSSKKRQIRNKVSARTFRARRKEHIEELEDQLADRDVLSKGLDGEIGKLKAENEIVRFFGGREEGRRRGERGEREMEEEELTGLWIGFG
ncbi:hypothetical protein BDY24DRAFT_394137 [Mrakia frigida]|uniref:uncharacterized protein n=1 Tax=Mrakia frigida TaxID=29902 RepID=UPI003FCC007C